MRKSSPRLRTTAQACIHPSRRRKRTCFVGERDPVPAGALVLDVAPQQFVLLRRPRTPLHARLVAARRPTHPLSSNFSSSSSSLLTPYRLRSIRIQTHACVRARVGNGHGGPGGSRLGEAEALGLAGRDWAALQPGSVRVGVCVFGRRWQKRRQGNHRQTRLAIKRGSESERLQPAGERRRVL
jgi:hypothetical protein